ncbi:AprI/Inh family metalloprotease inhibitor [Profundibacterium mesophilum]|uniref:Bacterial SH3 domain containing protein n=1 Tax=Profundibacterium mesophilum KAUST100406-0324 TaxID=1037889 RepID=A0A921NQR0_9RHOB|nr:AprI/Inh family metalloprotease inhibitor [Profundibacterium mesophilum]KAF0677151.1 Bacterial SH3 domain containing protein [Profundibacterium mesophilum KAUST100406-0324]
MVAIADGSTPPWMKLTALCALVSILASLAGWPGSALAQSREDFVRALAGDWLSQSGNFTQDGERCALRLLPSTQAPLPLQNANCSRELATVAAWDIDQGQIILLDMDGQELARLGGNQLRLNGDTIASNAVIFERLNERLLAAKRECVYLGYTSSCARQDELAPPRIEGPVQVKVLTRANLRASADPSSDILTVIEPETCVTADRCTAGPDGVWCRTDLGEQEGWIKKQGIRLNRFPAVIFANSCQKN